jgi:putative phosphoribosyl transferase
MKYFQSRAHAGKLLAEELKEYAQDNVAVVALSEGGALVGAQIAMRLHASLSLLMSENIYLPGEHDAVAALSSAGTFTTNPALSTGQVEEMMSNYHSYIEQQRMQQMQHINRLVGSDGEIKKDLLRRHIVILATDGLPNGFSLDIAYDFLKTVAIKRLVVAAAVASVPAVDKMHMIADEICCLDVKSNYMETNHYYTNNTIPGHTQLFQMMRQISLSWSLQEHPAQAHQSVAAIHTRPVR